MLTVGFMDVYLFLNKQKKYILIGILRRRWQNTEANEKLNEIENIS